MFSLAHVHLLLNHWPIIVPMVAFLVVAAAWAQGSDATARVALALLVGAALIALPAYLTGDAAEDAVRRAPGVTRDIIEQHADAAVWGAVMVGALGIFALWALWRFRSAPALPRWVLGTALGASLFVSTVMARVGLLGGEIRHTEVRSDPPAAFGVVSH